MAIIKVTQIGSGLSGSAGDIYFRIQNGKQVFCSKPTSYTLPLDERSCEIRDTLKDLSQISKTVCRVPMFHKMWFLKELKGTGPYHKFLSFNYPPEKTPFSFDNVSLTPSAHINAEVESFSYEKSTFNIKFKPLGEASGVNILREPFIGGCGFVIIPCNGKKYPYEIIEIPLKIQQTDLNNPLEFQIETKNNIFESPYKALFVLATFSSVEEPLRYSSTFICTKE